MEQANSIHPLLELISKPAFCVKDGMITYVNQAAKSMQLNVGTAIQALLKDNLEAYQEMEGGCLYASLCIAGVDCGASIIKNQDYYIFTLDDPTGSDQLRALALAGQQLRIPLANLVATIDTMFSVKKGDALRPYCDQIRRGVHQLHRIINNMSDTAYIHANTLADEVLNIGSLFDEAVAKSTHFLQQSGVQLYYKGLEQAVYTQANRSLLERAFFNMISNAVKFSPSQSPIRIELSQKDSKLLLSVTNQSEHMRPEMLSNAFNSFQRKPAVEDSRAGIGLGMPLIRAAAQSHGGTVLIDQPEENLVRVTLTIALRQPENPTLLRNPLTRFLDYAGGRDHALLELSEVLPAESYDYESD